MTRLAQRFAAARRGLDPYRIALLGLIALYVGVFTRLAWNLHAGMRTHKADLGQIDQAIWNSSRGRFVEMTDNGYIATRMSDHVEPILALISPVYWLWNDTRAILLLQTLFVAAGAWLLYDLTLTLFDQMLPAGERRYIWRVEPLREQSRPLALALVIAYLLAPQLQSALLTEFHAAPLVVPLILWAFLSVERRRWPQFVAAALLTALVKEEMALLAAGLGVWAVWNSRSEIGTAASPGTATDTHISTINNRQSTIDNRESRIDNQPDTSFTIHNSRFTINHYPGLFAGLFITAVSLAWFYLATFVIVPAHAAEVYGVAESGYFQRYGALGDSPADIFKSFFTQPGVVWQIAMEPARLRYVFNLLVVFGFLSLLAPEVLLLALPLFLANLLSAYPAQYYGEFHYSAPLMAYAAAAAAFGVSRIWRWLARRTGRTSAEFQHMPAAGAGTMALAAFYTNARTAIRPLMTVALVLWILGWALFAYGQFGRGPLGGRYDPTPITAHHRLLERFVDQIPADAAVTATAAVHPHVSHRRYVYQFPIGLDATGRELGNAEWALLDVTTNTDMAPGDLYSRVQEMLAGEWGVVDGADGFLLLRKGAPQKKIPDAFYDFARVPSSSADASRPLTLRSVRVDDWPRWRQTKIVAEWQVGQDFDPESMAPRLEVRTPAGETLYAMSELAPPALLWYPPERWQPGETIRVTTLPLSLPRDWGVAVSGVEPPNALLYGSDGLALAAAYTRQKDGVLINRTDEAGLSPFSQRAGKAFQTQVRFASGLALRAEVADRIYAPGEAVDVRLWWAGANEWPAGIAAFVHLRGPDGRQRQSDGLPRYVVTYDVGARLAQYDGAPDWRQLLLPDDAEPGERWEVVVGLYDPATGARIDVVDDAGNVVNNEGMVADVMVGAPPVPDQACALIPASCDSR
jgi:uncharacterized membrane protein